MKTELLFHIDQSGSLNAAAKKMNISYQHAWNLIVDLNISAPEPLVIKQRGGQHGGGAILTSYGVKLLNEYRQIEKSLNLVVMKMNNEIKF